MAMNHVIIPKTSLKQFSKSGKITYIDLNDNKIHTSTAKSFNTKKDYYPEETEKYLSSRIETSIGRLRTLLDNFSGDGIETMEITPEIRMSAIECFLVQLMRRPSFYKEVRKKSIFGSALNVTDEFFSGLHRGKNYIDIALQATEKFSSNYTVTLCTINKSTEFSFVLPSAHGFSVGNKMFFVLSPYRSLVLLNNKDVIKNENFDNTNCFYTIDDKTVLDSIYKKVIEAEKKDGVGKIIGLKNQLEHIQQLL